MARSSSKGLTTKAAGKKSKRGKSDKREKT